MNKQEKTLQIEGMSCAHCVKAVQEALGETEGVEVLSVEIGKARVRYDADQVSREDLDEAIEEAGFEVVGA